MDGLDWAASAMNAARRRLETAAENLANASTGGFRKRAVRGFLTALGAQMNVVAGETQGALRRTGGAADLALLGPGAFRVRDSSGRIETTRDGAFSRDGAGRLVDVRGRALMSERGPLCFPAGARLNVDGAVVDGSRVIDRLPMPRGTTVRVGFLEASNVDATSEMVDLIAAQRSFETAERVFAAIDGTRQKSSDDVGRLR